jgi:hypothetical protein
LEFKPEQVVYNSSTLPSNTQRNFLSGSGEGLSFNSVVLHFEGVIRVEGTLARSVIFTEFIARINFVAYPPENTISYFQPRIRLLFSGCHGP